jgi:hypothetical protein
MIGEIKEDTNKCLNEFQENTNKKLNETKKTRQGMEEEYSKIKKL